MAREDPLRQYEWRHELCVKGASWQRFRGQSPLGRGSGICKGLFCLGAARRSEAGTGVGGTWEDTGQRSRQWQQEELG